MLNPDIVRLHHMEDAANEIIVFLEGQNRDDLENNRMLSLSLVHLLEIIGEAANGISQELRERHKNIPWGAMIGMRNRLIHGYFDIDLDIVWETVKNDIPKLKEQLSKIILEEEA